MTRIKVCGLKRAEDIEYVNEALPDYCGFIVEFPKSSRCVSRETVRELVSRLDRRIVPVGVFVNAPVELPAQLFNEGTIGAVQLHGSEDEEYIGRLRALMDAGTTGDGMSNDKTGGVSGESDEDERSSEAECGLNSVRIIKAFSVASAGDVKKAAASSADMVLLDQGSGGTGKRFDWSFASDVGRPFFLAGGLGPENLGEAIESLKPWAVDLSSGLESNGLKDRDKIMKAVSAVREHQQ